MKLFQRNSQEREMAEELRFHLESRAAHLESLGTAPAEARRRARIEFGSLENYKEHCREALGWRLFHELVADIRHSCRTLLKIPGFTLVAVLSLALSIGVNLTCFASLYAMVLNPFGYPDAERVMQVFDVRTHADDREAVAPANYLDWQKQNHSFEQLGAYREWAANLTRVNHPDHVNAASISAEMFTALAVVPKLGRTFGAAECQAGRDDVVVVSRGFWQARLLSDPTAVGKSISLNGRLHTVIGVMPDEFNLPLAAELWTPLAFTPDELTDRRTQQLTVVGRLRDHVSQAEAAADLNRIATQLERTYPNTNRSHRAKVMTLADAMTAESRAFITVLSCAAFFVLLLGSINVGGLQIARAISRQKELGLRRALGASGWRIARQVVTENVILSLAGAVAGLGFSVWYLNYLRAGIPAEVYQFAAGLKNMRIDRHVVLYGLALSLVAGALAALPSLVESLRTTGTSGDLNQVLKEGGRTSRSSGRSALRAALVIGEIALAFVLLVGAGLMVGTLSKIASSDPGYDPANLLSARVVLNGESYKQPTRAALFAQDVLRQLAGNPGTDSSAIVSESGPAPAFLVEGHEHLPAEEVRPAISAASSGYLPAMRLPLLKGRWLRDTDTATSLPVVVLSDSVARHYWNNGDPIGQRIRFNANDADWLTVVGVSGDIKNWFSGQPEAAAYVSYHQFPPTGMSLLVRARKDPSTLAPVLRTAVKSVDKDQFAFHVQTKLEERHQQTTGIRNAASLMQAYGAIAFLLSVMGIYSITAFFVAQHKPDIAVRMSLGASRQSILAMVLGLSCRLAGWGLLAGVPIAALLTVAMSQALFGLVPIQPGVFVLFILLLSLSAALAGYVPALRATRLDPVMVLRQG